MFKKLIFILSLSVLSVVTNGQNAISGIVNQYYDVNTVSISSVMVMSASGLSAGDTVMLYQTKGADLNLAQSSSFGSINSINNAGNWEILKIQSVNTSTGLVTFTCNITKNFNAPLQLIRVPSYYNASISSALTCQQYDGIKGGVLCIIVRNNLAFNAGIDVSAKGFLGAQPRHSTSSDCASTGIAYQRYSYSAFCDSAGLKGEGVFGDPMGMYALGRGKAGNAGGGGNGLNAAGGGGGNGGSGGQGGGESDYCTTPYNVGGIGGLAMLSYYSNGKIFMGGAGGAGLQEIVTSDALAGGNGGGIVIIIANNIVGNNQIISAKGGDVNGTTYEESAGGGGAGGTVFLYANSLTGNLNVNVSGGKGGNTLGGMSAYCRGSGGGGGGGMILSNSAASAITKYLSGGSTGTAATACTSWLGSAGNEGNELTISSIPFTCITLSTNSIINIIQADQTICSGKTPSALTGPVPTGGTGTITDYLWEQSTDGGFTWLACPLPNNTLSYSFSTGITQTTRYRRKVIFSGGESSFSNVVTITVNPLPTPTASNTGPYCQGQTISVSALPSGMNSYTWSGPLSFTATTQNATRTAATTSMAGLYTVTVYDSNNCSATATTNVVFSPLHTANATNTGPYCPGETIQLNLTTSGFNFNWAGPGGFTSSLQNPTRLSATPLMSGTYSVSVTGTGACPVITTTNVVVDAPINISVNETPVLCNGNANGALTANVTGGSSPFSYHWNTGVNGPTISGLTAGTYHVTVTDTYGCSSTNSVILPEPPILFGWVDGGTVPTCNGDSDASSVMGASGGTSPYTFTWSNGYTGNPLINVPADIYTCTITDSHACTFTWSVWIQDPPTVQPYIDSNSLQPSCFGSSDGMIIAGSNGGVSPYTYYWDNGSTNDTITGLTQGFYFVTVTDSHGCSAIDTALLVWPPELIITPVDIDNPTAQNNDGYIDISSSGGTLPISFSWSNGQFTQNIDSLPAGTYTVTATDAHSCTSVESFTLVPLNIDLVIAGDSLICQGSEGILFPGSSFPVITGATYMWNTGDTSDTLIINPVTSQYYSLTITSPLSLQYVDSIWVEIVPNPVFHITGDSIICEGSSTTLAPSSTSNNYTYSWSTGLNTQTINISPQFTTVYHLTVTENGCSSTDSIEIQVSPDPQMTLSYGDSICPGGQAEVTIVFTSGTSPWQFNVTNGADTWPITGISGSPYNLNFIPNDPGTYNVVDLTDANGCAGNTGSFTITFNPAPVAFAGNDTAVCSNSCRLNGYLAATDTGRWTQNPNAWFGLLNNEINNPNATAGVLFTNNIYTFIWTVGNSYGCTDSDTVLVNYRSNPNTAFAGDDMQVMYSTEVQLNATPPPSGTGTGHWNLIDGTGLIADTMLWNTMVTGLSLGDNIFRWTVENPPCPSKYDEVVVSILSVTIPTGYSPNGDGTNDYFIVTGLGLYPENSLEVFNRWGIMVYSSYPYNNNWNGKDMNEHILPDDTYFYVLHLNTKEFIKGYVIIHR